MVHPHLQAVRERYQFRCGYCGVSEEDTGGELTVDHFHPVTAGGDEAEDNLVYACFRCNLYKGAVLPLGFDGTPEQRLIHPLSGDLSYHLEEELETGMLLAKTATGRFHINALRLNRPPLISYRRRKQMEGLLTARLEQARAENEAILARLDRLELYLTHLRERFGL